MWALSPVAWRGVGPGMPRQREEKRQCREGAEACIGETLEEEVLGRDRIPRKARGGKGDAIVLICYYIFSTFCSPSTVLSTCTGVTSFDRHIPTDEDTEAQGGEVSRSGPHSWHMVSELGCKSKT